METLLAAEDAPKHSWLTISRLYHTHGRYTVDFSQRKDISRKKEIMDRCGTLVPSTHDNGMSRILAWIVISD